MFCQNHMFCIPVQVCSYFIETAARHHHSIAVVHPKNVEQESLKFRMWCLGPFETI